jgi:holliday junction DNA helicase RuvA
MIAYIKGTVEHIFETSIVIDNNGMGYEIFIMPHIINKLPKDVIKIFIYTHAKEDGDTLYGFLLLEELKTFNMLISVSGVGPKAGLSILSTMNTAQIITSILSDDVESFSKAQGIGKKTAQRIILDLKDKVKNHEYILNNEVNVEQKSSIVASEKQEAMEALITLGYNKNESVKVVLEVYTEEMTTEQIIKAALRKIANKQ